MYRYALLCIILYGTPQRVIIIVIIIGTYYTIIAGRSTSVTVTLAATVVSVHGTHGWTIKDHNIVYMCIWKEPQTRRTFNTPFVSWLHAYTT